MPETELRREGPKKQLNDLELFLALPGSLPLSLVRKKIAPPTPLVFIALSWVGYTLSLAAAVQGVTSAMSKYRSPYARNQTPPRWSEKLRWVTSTCV